MYLYMTLVQLVSVRTLEIGQQLFDVAQKRQEHRPHVLHVTRFRRRVVVTQLNAHVRHCDVIVADVVLARQA